VSTKLILILLLVTFLFWFISLQTSFSLFPIPSKTICEGPISLTLSPNYGFVGDTITASISNLRGEGCTDKRIYIKESSCQGLQYCSCLLNQMTENIHGCVCTFRAPPTPYISGAEPTRENTFIYYACVDLDDDGVYDEALEQDYANLLVHSRYAPLSLVTESVIIIVTLGVLLVIIIVVFRMSLRRR